MKKFFQEVKPRKAVSVANKWEVINRSSNQKMCAKQQTQVGASLASNSWFEHSHHHSLCVTGKAVSADIPAANIFPVELQ
jgi:hypothetical protein